MRLGISSYAFTWAVGVPGYPVADPMDALQLLDKAKALDVACVQIADNMPLHVFNLNELIELRTRAQDLNIAIEVGTRGLQPENVLTYLDIAELFQSPILRIVIDATGFESDVPEIIEILHKLVPELEKRSIKLAIENHDRFKALEFFKILNAVNSDHIGICLDSVNSMGAGEGVQVVTEILGPHTLNLHVKDFTVRRIDHKMGFQIEGLPAGNGMLPLAWMLEKINPACGSAILEQWTPPEKTLQETIKKENEWAQQSIAYLKPFFIEELDDK